MLVTDLPSEMLEKIVGFLPKQDMYATSCVSTSFRAAVHYHANRNIRNLLRANIIDKRNLARVGWKDEAQHDIVICSCIDIAFRYKPFGLAFEGHKIRHSLSPGLKVLRNCTVGEDNIFYAVDSSKEDEGGADLLVLDRAGNICPNFKVPAAESEHRWTKHLYIKGFTLLSLTFTDDNESLSSFEIKVYDTRSLELAYTIDFLDNLDEGILSLSTNYCVADIYLTKGRLAVHIYSAIYRGTSHVLLYKIDVDNPDLNASFLYAIERNPVGITEMNGNLCMNDKFLILQAEIDTPSCLKSHLYIFEEKPTNSKFVEVDSLTYEHSLSEEHFCCNLKLEEGQSPFLVSWEWSVATLVLINLSTRQTSAAVSFTACMPCNWFGGVFLMVRQSSDYQSYQLLILDPRASLVQQWLNTTIKEAGDSLTSPGRRIDVGDLGGPPEDQVIGDDEVVVCGLNVDYRGFSAFHDVSPLFSDKSFLSNETLESWS